jgi:hypothetical protein
VHALPLPTKHAFATHFPLVVLQMLPPVHCVSLVHLPQKFGCVAPQMDPLALLLQSVSTRQSPGVQDPLRHKLSTP